MNKTNLFQQQRAGLGAVARPVAESRFTPTVVMADERLYNASMEVVVSKSGTPIRLPDERWEHITEEHTELADRRQDVLRTVSQPDEVYRGAHGELLATLEVDPGRWLVVVYRETELDGFIITAFLTTRKQYLGRRQKLWP